MTLWVHRVALVGLAYFVLTVSCGIEWRSCRAQEELIDRPAPPAADDLEADKNKDGIPDGWYNALDIKWMAEGGASGPHFVRFECKQRGRPARLSRAFGVDGRKIEAVVLGLWIRQTNIQSGEREGDEPQLMIDFLGEPLGYLSRGIMGPWVRSARDRWTRVAKRIPVPPGTRDAIMSVGLMGATGTLDVDGLTVELIPVGGEDSTNLVVNGGFELGDPAPASWIVEGDARRVFPGNGSPAAVELVRAKSRLLIGLALPVDGLQALDVSMAVRCTNLRGGGGAHAVLFFLDELGRPLPDPAGSNYFLLWAGSGPWRLDEASVRVPPGASRAVLQFEKRDSFGSIRIDDVRVTASPDPAAGTWVPYHTADETGEWLAVPPSRSITPKSALDVSFLLPAPAGARGFVSVKDGRLAFKDGGRARFFGVSLISPTAFLPRELADALADRLARSGVNLVRLGDLDMPNGPNRSLFDDTRDDTKAFDPEALARLDHLIAAFKARGIYVALELQGKRRFRGEDGVALAGMLPAGGGPAAQFDPTIGKLAIESARPTRPCQSGNRPGTERRSGTGLDRAGGRGLPLQPDRNAGCPSAPLREGTPVVGGERPGRPGTTFLGIRRVGSFQRNGGGPAEGPCPCADRRRLTLAPRTRVQRGPGKQGVGLDRRPSVLEPPCLGVSRKTLPPMERARRQPRGYRRNQTPARSSLRPWTLVQPNPGGLVLPARGGRPDAGRLHRAHG